MPELPEVETIVRDLKCRPLFRQPIVKAAVYWPRSIATPSAETMVKQLEGDQIINVSRRAKLIVLHLKSGWFVLIHLRMSGRIDVVHKTEPRQKHQHVVLHFKNGQELRFKDPRKFGRWYLLKNPAEKFAALGPEPLEAAFTVKVLAQRLQKKNRQLKPLLLDQGFIAGLGNIYADEALWAAGLHPMQPSSLLQPADIKRLHKAIREVLTRGIRNLGTSLGQSDTNYYSVGGRRGRNQDALRVFRRTGEACHACGTFILKMIVAQRSTHVCPLCQNHAAFIKKP